MRHRYPGFTLIEVLIVVVIMAVLAATIIPQFTSSTTDAKKSARDFNTHSLQAQIELYRIDHNGTYPTVANIAEVLTSATDLTGAAVDTPDDTHPYGPYILGNDLPKNPFNSSSAVTAGTGTGPGSNDFGWQYNATTGQIWPNDTQYWADQPTP
jgi:prepilin-type N-terminal cleavage/methylation domain-containing protein